MNSTSDSYTFHKTIIYSGIGFITFAGIFGNFNIILIHLRKSSLRTKYATSVYRSTCFHLLFPYVFFHCMQTGLLATISLDLLISIIFPVKHRTFENYKYITIISIPTLLYAVTSVTLGFIFLNDSPVKMCNPPSSLQTTANEFWYAGALVAGGIVIINYLAAYAIILYKSRNNRFPLSVERRAMKSLSVILLVFVFTRYIGTVVTNLLVFTKSDPAVIALFQNYAVFFAFLLYSQNFYVSYWRSTDYRGHLKEQIVLGLLVLFPNSQRIRDQLPILQLFSHGKTEHTRRTSSQK